MARRATSEAVHTATLDVYFHVHMCIFMCLIYGHRASSSASVNGCVGARALFNACGFIRDLRISMRASHCLLGKSISTLAAVCDDESQEVELPRIRMLTLCCAI